MTLKQFIDSIKAIALTQKNVRSAGDGDIYTYLNSNPNLQYGVVFVVQNQHQSTEETDRYSINLFYADRQVNFEGCSNLQIQSIGKEVLENIIKIFCERYDADVYGDIVWQSWRERFADALAGIYAVVTIEITKDTICID